MNSKDENEITLSFGMRTFDGEPTGEMYNSYAELMRAQEFADGLNDVPEMVDAFWEEQRERKTSPRMPKKRTRTRQAMNKAARSIDGLQNGEIVWSDSKEATKEMKEFQKVFKNFLGLSSVFGFVKNTTSRNRPYKAFDWPRNSPPGANAGGASGADFRKAFNAIERGSSPYRLAFEVRKNSPGYEVAGNNFDYTQSMPYKLRTFGEARDSFRWKDIDPWLGNGIASDDLRPQKTKDSMPRSWGVEQGMVKLAPPIHFIPQIEVDEDDFRFKYEAKEGAKANANDISLFLETKPPFIIQGSPPKFGNYTWGFNEEMDSMIENWASNGYDLTESLRGEERFRLRGGSPALPFQIDVELGEAIDIANPDTNFPVLGGRPKITLDELGVQEVLDRYLGDNSPDQLTEDEYNLLLDRNFDELEDEADKAELVREIVALREGPDPVMWNTGQKPEFITTSKRAKTPDGYKIPGYLFEPIDSQKLTKKQMRLHSSKTLTDDRYAMGDPIQSKGKLGDLTFSKKRPQFRRIYKNADGKKVTFESRKAGDGLVIWNNKSSARKIADIGRSRGWLMRTVPVAGGWVNLAASRTHYQPFDSRYNDENRQILESFNVAQSSSGGYRFGTVIDGYVDDLSKTKLPRSINSSPKSLYRNYFRRLL